MSGTRQPTNSTLRLSERSDAEAPSGSSGSWLGALVRLLRCNGKKWHKSNSGSATPTETLETKNLEELEFGWLTSNVASKVFKVLLVFPRDDQQSEILAGVARKLGWSVSEARNAEEAAELFRIYRHDLAIVDRRSATRAQDADQICRILIGLSTTLSFNVIALVNRMYFTNVQKDEEPILHLLNVGYYRALMECSHKGILMNELIGIYASEAQPKSQLAAAQLLYFIVDTCQDIIHVTNDQHIVQFANKTSEEMLGFKKEELIGRPIKDLVTFENFALVHNYLRRRQEFLGNVVWRKKNNKSINIDCRAVPVSIPMRNTTFYIYIYDTTSKYEPISSSVSFHNFTGQEGELNEGHSLEAKPSNKPRRSTVTKLHNLLLDSPITKVISLLSSAGQGSVDPEVSAKIETAIKILKNTELYTPRLREDDPLPVSDPIISDLLESLISVSSKDANTILATVRKQSTVTKIPDLEEHHMQAKLIKSPEMPQELEELLETHFDWNFDIFMLETLTNRRPLYFLGMTLLNKFRVADRLHCDEKTLQNWLTIIEANYNIHVSYHNSSHAADVLQATARFLKSKRLEEILDPLDEVTALLAAITHDIGHPGKSSQFLSNANNKLAILYNDLSVLESHHSALTFKVTLSDDNVNIFKNLTRDVYKTVRQNIIDMILATEMTKHFEHLAKFVNVCSNRINDEYEVFPEDPLETSVFLLPENLTLIKRMMIKCADVSNPTRPLRLYVEWTRRIAEEYFNQTDEEKRKMMPVVMPMFDRASCSIPKLQIGFVDYIINDMMEAWDAFIDIPEIIGNMRQNYEKWKEYHEQGIMTLEDIENLQQSPELQLYKQPFSRQTSACELENDT